MNLKPNRHGRVVRRWPALARLALLALLALPCVARADLVTGTVRDQNGQPIFNADFNVYDYASGEKLLASDKTDANGFYRLVVDPGIYDLLCQVKDVNRGFASQVKRGVAVNGALTVDYVLPPSVRVLGRVFYKAHPADIDSLPVYPCNLDFDRTDDGARQPSLGNVTSPFGTFIDYIEAGNYTVTANPADTSMAPARVFAWDAPNPTILDMTCGPAVHLASVIRDDHGRPVEGAIFRFDDTLGVRHPSTKAISDLNGFLRDGIAPDVYRITVEPKLGSNLAALRVKGVDLTTSRQQDFTLATGAVVSGRVTDKQGFPIVNGNWLAVVEATEEGAATPGDHTLADGSYRFVLAPGVYRLKLTPPASTGLDSVQFDHVTVARDTVIDVDYAALGGGGGSGDSPVVRFGPGKNPTHTTASISLVLSRPVQDALLEVYDTSGRRARVLHDGALSAGAQTIPWDGRRTNGAQAHTGIYFVRARLDGHEQITRFVLLP
jgi:hypothetical protein